MRRISLITLSLFALALTGYATATEPEPEETKATPVATEFQTTEITEDQALLASIFQGPGGAPQPLEGFGCSVNECCSYDEACVWYCSQACGGLYTGICVLDPGHLHGECLCYEDTYH
jgi:hypothetical protein